MTRTIDSRMRPLGTEESIAKKQYLVRNVALLGALDLAESLGVSRRAIMTDVGIRPSMVASVGIRVPFACYMDAVESAAILTGRADFGFLLATAVDHRNIGPLGLLMEQAETFAEAMKFAHRFLYLHNNGWSSAFVRCPGGTSLLRFTLHTRGKYLPQQYVEALTLTHVRLAKLFLGSAWMPRTVSFKHKRVSPRAVSRRYLGPNVRFEQNVDGIEFSVEELSREVTAGEPEVRRRLEAMLCDLEAQQYADFLGRVAELVRLLLPLRRATIEELAKRLATTPRTLQRQLSKHRANFHDLLASIRLDMARECMGDRRLSLTQTAPLLGFSEPSALSRFLRQHGGLRSRDLWRTAARGSERTVEPRAGANRAKRINAG